jgi:hypothetical protein
MVEFYSTDSGSDTRIKSISEESTSRSNVRLLTNHAIFEHTQSSFANIEFFNGIGQKRPFRNVSKIVHTFRSDVIYLPGSPIVRHKFRDVRPGGAE